MTTEYITGIWLAKFESETELKDYLELKYFDGEDNPKSSFASDINLDFFDTDFLECAFVGTSLNIPPELNNFSFVELFKDKLTTNLNSVNFSGKNSIISLSGKKNGNESINDSLFADFRSTVEKDYLQFIGLFRFSDSA